jgi:sarcosine/dimethylglycine N-methyltransferase
VPWAQSAATSFLSTPTQTEADLRAAGFEIASFRDTSADVIKAQEALRQKSATDGAPKLGVHTFLGDRFLQYRANSERSLQDGRVALVEALVRKPG